MSVRERLEALADAKNAAFTARLIPDVPPETILGAYQPQLRALAGELRGTPEAEAFLRQLPHTLHEENLLHAFLLDGVRDFGACLAEVERFLPHVDNWAVCDSLRPKAFRKRRAELLPEVERWLASDRPYTVRFGLGMLMCHYLDEAFEPRLLDAAAALRSDEYYVNMMRAWLFATALAKRYEETLPLLTERRLDPWTHGKTIQKAVESRRVPEAHKQFLKTLRG